MYRVVKKTELSKGYNLSYTKKFMKTIGKIKIQPFKRYIRNISIEAGNRNYVFYIS